jgi:hypothetical protein
LIGDTYSLKAPINNIKRKNAYNIDDDELRKAVKLADFGLSASFRIS